MQVLCPRGGGEHGGEKEGRPDDCAARMGREPASESCCFSLTLVISRSIRSEHWTSYAPLLDRRAERLSGVHTSKRGTHRTQTPFGGVRRQITLQILTWARLCRQRGQDAKDDFPIYLHFFDLDRITIFNGL